MNQTPAFWHSYENYARFELEHRSKTITQTLGLITKLCFLADSENLSDLTTDVIRSFLHQGRSERNWSAKTFRLYRQYLKTFFMWAVGEGYLEINPVTPIKQPRLPKRLPRCLSPDEARKVLLASSNCNWYSELQCSRNEAICYTLVYAGLRLSEFINLRSNDVCLKEKTIRVVEGKNDKERLIPISDDLRLVLGRYQRDRKRLGVKSQWFFGSSKSEKQLTKKNATDIFRRVSKKSGVKFTAHMLRHTFGRICVESDIDIRTIQIWMGHEDIRTTQIYTYVSLSASQKAMKKLRC